MGVVAGIIIPQLGIRRKKLQNWSCRNSAGSAENILSIKRNSIKFDATVYMASRGSLGWLEQGTVS